MNVGIELIEDPDTTEIKEKIDSLNEQNSQTQQVFFKEERIPTGDIVSISKEEQNKLSEEEKEEIA